jgi:predicted metal-dependent HD superfamily phosphohydrolase
VEQLLRAQWQAALGHTGGTSSCADDHLERLLARYREPQRHYHTVTHLAAVLATAEDLMGEVTVTDREAVRLALFFHDAVYDPRSDTNEADSAALARAVLSELEVPSNCVDAVAGLVMATRHLADAPAAGASDPATPSDARAATATTAHEIDTSVVLDADLAILAAEPSRYEAYATGVRAEYAHVDDATWRTRRATVLRAFLERAAIYRTEPMRRQEHRARANLAAELSSLAAP